MKKILIVEDEAIVAVELELYILSLGYNVVGKAHSTAEAYRLLESVEVDTCLLDVNLEGNFEGIGLAHFLNLAYPSVSIIYITAYTDSNVLSALSQTTYHTYLVKPFRREDLNATLKLLYFKTQNEPKAPIDLGNALTFDLSTNALYASQSPIELTKQEQIALHLLAQNIGQILPYEALDTYIWHEKVVGDNARRNLIYKINKKTNEKLIKSKSGIGYYIEKP